MSRKNGQMLTCDRCGTWVFLECTGEGSADGGYTRWNTFEPADVWKVVADVGNVCPTCWQDYQDMLERYKRKPAQVRRD